MAINNYELKKQRQALIQNILSSDLHGKRIYLLGSSEFGPVNEPILVKSTMGLYNKFGKNGTLINAFHALKYVNKDNKVYVVKTTGSHSTAYINVNVDGGDIVTDGLVIVANQANEYFDDIEILIDIDKITFKFPKELNINDIVYKYKDYYNIDRLVYAINNDTKKGKSILQAYHGVDPATPLKNAFYTVNPSSIYLYGGQCGLYYTKNMLYNCLEKTYEVLESHDIDIIIPVDAFIDDICPIDIEDENKYGLTYYKTDKDYLTQNTSGKQLSYLDQLINFCIKQLNFGVVTTGVIGFNSCYEHWSYYLKESDDISKMFKVCLKYNLECCSNPFYSFLVSAVAGDIMYNKGKIIDNGYLAYAALCSKTIMTTGTTNIPISDTISIWNEFSESILNELSNNGIVTFRHSPLYNTPVVYDGITIKTDDENLKLYCNVRMIQMAISYINKLFQFYIGQDLVKLIKQDIIKSDLNTLLNAIKQKGIITKYDFNLVPFYGKGEVKVYLNLQTNYMIKPVNIYTVINTEYIEDV